jgi:hypothetical protein
MMPRQMINFLILAAVIAGLFGWILSESPSFQSCIYQYQEQTADKSHNDQNSTFITTISVYVLCSEEFSDLHAGGITALATIFIAAFTATLWVSIWTQSNDTKASIAEAARAAAAMGSVAKLMAENVDRLNESVATTKQISERQKSFGEMQMRAYVYVAEITVFNVANPIQAENETIIPSGAEINDPKLGPSAEIKIRNTGNTPAYGLIHWAQLSFREYPLKSPLSGTPDLRHATKIPLAQGIITTKTYSFPHPLTDTEIAQLRAGTYAIYLYGGITYEDIFGRRRFTNFRYFHNELSGRIGVSTAMTGAEDGNEIDRPDYKLAAIIP